MAFKTLFNEVEFLAQYPMVGLAITDSTGPVPGYLFGEINAITYVDNGINCKILVNFLISHLKPDTPVVCIKILKLLLYLVKNGHSQMIHEVRLHEVHLKEARRFNGPADDVYGNSFYQMIRKMAKELLDVIFSENIESTETTSFTDSVVLSGYGSQASSKKMTGFGYTAKVEKSVTDVVSDSFSNFVEKLFPSPDKETEPLIASHIGDALPKYKPIVIEKSQYSGKSATIMDSSIHSLPSVAPKPQKKVKVHRPGRAGGGWESSSDEDENNATPPLLIESSKDSTESVESMESSKAFVECIPEVSEEHKIVDEVTVNKPLTELNFEDVQQICKRCSSANCEEILSFTLEKLADTEEYIQLRALVFIEYLLFHDVITIDSVVRIVLPNLQRFLEDDKKIKDSVRIKTMKICKTIELLNSKYQKKFHVEETFSPEQTTVKS